MKAHMAGHGPLTDEKLSTLTGNIGKLDAESLTSEQMVQAVDVILQKLFSLTCRNNEDRVKISFPEGELWVSPLLNDITLRNFKTDEEKTLGINHPVGEDCEAPFNKPYVQYSTGSYSSIRAEYDRQSGIELERMRKGVYNSMRTSKKVYQVVNNFLSQEKWWLKFGNKSGHGSLFQKQKITPELLKEIQELADETKRIIQENMPTTGKAIHMAKNSTRVILENSAATNIFDTFHPGNSVIKSWKDGEMGLMGYNLDTRFVSELQDEQNKFYLNDRDGAILSTLRKLKKDGIDLIAFYHTNKEDYKVFHDSHRAIFASCHQALERLRDPDTTKYEGLSEIPVSVWIILSAKFDQKQ